ncbi:MAG: ABC transporter permease, partial [Chitinophagales bacterium]|nr:ABC transporter permease [Chitinophagales bacterium]
IKTELFKIFSRPRSYIGFLAISVIVIIIHLAMFLDGPNYIQLFIQQLQQSFSIQGKIINGNLVAWLILQTLIIQMPLLVALVTGDLLSGEAATGTIRLLATKPISRSNIVLAKFISGSFYTVALVLWLGVISLFVGLVIFGSGDLIVLSSDHATILRSDDTLWRFLSAMLIACLSLTVITSLSLMLSSFTDNSIGPIVSSISIVIIFTIIGTMEFPLFQMISPFLFTTHMIIWRGMFNDPIDWNQMITSLSVLTAHIFIFTGITIFNFSRKDILN